MFRPIPRAARVTLLGAAIALLVSGCARQAPIPVYTELPSPDALYAEGTQELDRQRARRILPKDFLLAIEIFQDIIDNYPYSPEAVLAELAIVDIAHLDQLAELLGGELAHHGLLSRQNNILVFAVALTLRFHGDQFETHQTIE